MSNSKPIDALNVAVTLKGIFDDFNQLWIRAEQDALSSSIKQRLFQLNTLFLQVHKSTQVQDPSLDLNQEVKNCNGDSPCNGAANA